MEVRSPRVQEWGAVAWGIAAAAFLIGGVFDSVRTGRNLRVQHSGERNSTDAVLQPVMGSANASEYVRCLLQQVPGTGPVAVIYQKEFVHFSEAALAISVLAWPTEAWLIQWDGSEAAQRRLNAAADGRRFFIGPEILIPGFRFEQLGPQYWSVKKQEAR